MAELAIGGVSFFFQVFAGCIQGMSYRSVFCFEASAFVLQRADYHQATS
jgi:hypothetical protein